MEYFNKTSTNDWSLLGYLEWRSKFADFSNKLYEHSVFFDLIKKISDEGGARGEMAKSIWKDFKEGLLEVDTFWNKREIEVIELQRKRKLWQIESSDLDYIHARDKQLEKHVKIIRKNRTTVEQTRNQAKVSVMDLSSILSDPENSHILGKHSESNNDGLRTPPLKSFEVKGTKDITTPQKPKLCERSFQYLSKHMSVNINEQGLIMKVDQDVIIPEIPDEIQQWLIKTLSSEKDKFLNAIVTSSNPEDRFQKICKIILYDFFSMTSESLLDRNIGERKYTVEQIVPLFKAVQSVYRQYKFDWIEVQLDCIKDMKLLFPGFNLTLNKADGVCMKASNNKEIVFIEVSGGPDTTVERHVWEDTEKLIKEAMFGLVSLLRGHLDKNAMNAKNIRTYMVQVIGDRMTLSEIRLVEKHHYIVSQLKSAVLPFSFDDIENFFEIFELLFVLLSGLEGQKSELKKLALTKPVKDVPIIRDWIWVPESIVEWEAI